MLAPAHPIHGPEEIIPSIGFLHKALRASAECVDQAFSGGEGIAVTGVTNDYDNDPRGNPPDIGADETNLIGPPRSAPSRKVQGAAGACDTPLPP